jgi:superfamily II RNA helicase
MLREVEDQYFMCPPTLHPRDDMKVNNDRFNRAFRELEELEPKLRHNVVHQAQDSEDAESNALFQHKANLRAKANELREQKRNSELNRFKSELSNRAKVLRRLGHLDECDVITTKGKATCQIDTADELVTSELMFNGAFNKVWLSLCSSSQANATSAFVHNVSAHAARQVPAGSVMFMLRSSGEVAGAGKDEGQARACGTAANVAGVGSTDS